MANTGRAVAAARASGTEAVHVRFQGRAWRQRDEALGRRPKCLEGSWGAEFAAGVEPRPGEAVFTRRACFDAFLGDSFERHLVARGVRHLLFAGLFADICVDSTARTAFRKGFEATVLRDCTTGLHLPDEQVLSLMSRLYGARIATDDLAEAWSRRPGRGAEAVRVRQSGGVAGGSGPTVLVPTADGENAQSAPRLGLFSLP